LSLTASGSVAVGVNHETIDRVGTTLAGGAALPGGFLVRSSNAGTIVTDKFAVGLPSRILVGYQVTDHLNAFVGYDLVYLTNTVRPGDQIDLAVQTNATGGLARPSAAIHQTDFWANSLLAGLAFKY
jgi:hypothetical protein